MTAANADYTEKRDLRRLNMNSPVTITYAGKDFSGICKDLSGAGMLIETGDNFSIGDKLTVTIKQQTENTAAFNAHVEVIRVSSSDNSTHTIGLAIQEIFD